VGILKFFKQLKQKQKERAISKNLKVIKNPKAIREERVSAIEYFKNLREVDTSVPSLLNRFDYSLDHGIYDTREKEAAMEGVLKFGADAIPFVREHLLGTTRIAWPIKILQKLGEDQIVIDALESCLYFSDFAFDRDKIDKNYDILCYLRDYSLPDKGEKLLTLLEALDERIRFACAEVLLAQASPAGLKALEPFLTDTSSENTRIHQIVIDAFVDKGWSVSLDLPEGSQIAPGIILTKEKKLRRP
jgi:hypothetical protein